MKRLKLIVVMLLTLGLSAGSFAQQTQTTSAPHAFKYQAVARDVSGNPIANQNVSFRISILQGSAEGATAYQETQTATTNQYGLANLNIGRGNVVSGAFDSIQWGNGSYFVKIEFDPKGGTDYALMGTSEMLSVPYALYAEQTNFPIKAALQGTNLQAPFDSPQTGMLVYNTDSAGTAPYNVVPGYYYNAGTATTPKWVLLSVNTTNTDNSEVLKAHPPCTTYQFDGCGGNTSTSAANNTGFGDVALTNITTGTNNTAFGQETMGNLLTGADNICVGHDVLDLTSGPCYRNIGIGDFVFTNESGGTDNVSIGYNTTHFDGGSSYNTISGSEAFYNGGSGLNSDYNTGTGYSSLYNETKGSSNTAMGAWTLYNNTADQSTATGDSALYNNTSGLHNTANGTYSLVSNTTGSSNTAVGYEAMYKNTGDWNTAIGDSAMYNNGNGYGNMAAGQEALRDNTTGYGNTAIGASSGVKNTTGVDNTVVGYGSLQQITIASMNTATGAWALDNNTGDANTAVGDSALYTNGAGIRNVAVGWRALQSNTTADYNTATGVFAMLTNGTGTENAAFGYAALYTNATGSYNSALGLEALYNNTASENTSLGFRSCYENISGTYNTATGYQALYNNETGNGNTADGYGALQGPPGGYSNSYNTAIGENSLNQNTTGDSNTACGVSALLTNASGNANTTIGYGADVGTSTGLRAATAIGFNSIVNESNALVLGGLNSNYVYVGIGTETPKACLHIADAGYASSNCHIKSSGTAPGITTSVNGFTTITITSSSTDTKGEIDCTGHETVGGFATVQVNYNKAYNTGTVPIVQITPYTTNTANANEYGYFVASSGPSSFTLYIYVTGSTAGTAPSFFYFVIE